MRFIIDADLPRSAKGLLVRYGHEAIDVRDVGLASASDSTIAGFAQAQNACLLTGDWGFADIRNYPPDRFGGIVVLELPRDATARFISRLIEALEGGQERISGMCGPWKSSSCIARGD